MNRSQNNIRAALSIFILVETFLFSLGAISRLGLSFPWQESRNILAVSGQGIGAFLLVAVLVGIWTNKRWVSWFSWFATVFGFLGTLTGMGIIASGAVLQTQNWAYLTIAILAVSTGALVLRALWQPKKEYNEINEE